MTLFSEEDWRIREKGLKNSRFFSLFLLSFFVLYIYIYYIYNISFFLLSLSKKEKNIIILKGRILE